MKTAWYWPLVSATTCKELESYHFHPYKKKLDKLKINNFLGPIRELRSQDKWPPWKPKRWGHLEGYSKWDLLIGRRICWSHKQEGTLKWWFWWIAGGWVRTSVKVKNWRGHRLRRPPHFFGFTPRNPSRFPWWGSQKDPLVSLAEGGEDEPLWSRPRALVITKSRGEDLARCNSEALSHPGEEVPPFSGPLQPSCLTKAGGETIVNRIRLQGDRLGMLHLGREWWAGAEGKTTSPENPSWTPQPQNTAHEKTEISS